MGTLVVIALIAIVAVRSPHLRREVRACVQRVAGRRPHFVSSFEVAHFQRGNLHTHSTRSDGTAPLEAMVGWYRDHDYQFLAMTEHDLRLDPTELSPLQSGGFVLIPGEEVTDSWDGHPLHVNALCARGSIPGKTNFARADEGLSAVLAAIRAEGGVPIVNHPNYGWSLTADDLEKGTSGRFLLEIWSALPVVQCSGDGTHPSEEAIWDDVLARGVDAVPAAVDDAHGLHDGPGGSDGLPGRGWVETFGEETSTTSICEALRAGDLYASSGPELAHIAVRDDRFSISTRDAASVVTFVGEHGEILARVPAARGVARDGLWEVTYHLHGGEASVRARIEDGVGHSAWTRAERVAL
jgi:hypothetical protein